MTRDAPATEALRAAEQAARASYSRLLAFLAARSRDVAASEDALADAFHAALKTWPRTGVPEKPEAWLLTAARRRLLDGIRHARVQGEAVPTLLAVAREAQELATTEAEFPDDRLKLLFICAHPAIDAGARTPLMLQTVLGLDAARIASAFVVQPAAMGQRLTRAKAKIRDARIAFELPETTELPARLDAVLEAVYAAYGSGWDDVAGADPRRKGLAVEAIDLGRLLLRLMPGEPEAQGLLALMLHCEARRDARRTASGGYVPLSKQDAAQWSRTMIEEADRCLAVAAQSGHIGRFQLEAAIQSVHARRALIGLTDWESIALLYEGLVRLAPTIGAHVGRAAAVAEARGAAVGLSLLEAIPAEAIKIYQPYWAVAADLFKRLQRSAEAQAAYSRAIGLCEDPAMRDFLVQQAQRTA
ncbi:RNA polymerase sigma-70 factor, ECF subfamily [Rhizobiales bacterium GAS191]|nr:RNA polymerase sigma-70 factor, ECF subfamily [Rhizobiales bacterium GAS113]SEE34764.1 RNA polymerase sigma-70 factor, ECF subfamily [Rhizobiales bacterium GAS191]